MTSLATKDAGIRRRSSCFEATWGQEDGVLAQITSSGPHERGPEQSNARTTIGGEGGGGGPAHFHAVFDKHTPKKKN